MCTVLSLSEHRVVGLDVDQNKEIGGLIVGTPEYKCNLFGVVSCKLRSIDVR